LMVAAHLARCDVDGRARREQLLRHLQATIARSQVQRRESVLPGARAVSARALRPAPLDEPSMRARPLLAYAERLKPSRP